MAVNVQQNADAQKRLGREIRSAVTVWMIGSSFVTNSFVVRQFGGAYMRDRRLVELCVPLARTARREANTIFQMQFWLSGMDERSFAFAAQYASRKTMMS